MKIIVTGSLGNIGKPLTQELIKNGHSVTVVSSNAARKDAIESLGAKAAIGELQDTAFISKTFEGADVVYTMATNSASTFFDQDVDIIDYMVQIAKNYKQAIEKNNIKKVVHLSSIGAHTDKANGILRFHYEVEKVMNELPEDVSIKIMRPTGFYTNILRSIPTIKNQGAIISNYGGDQKEPWVSPKDIATAIAEEIELPFNGTSIRYLASDEASPNEIAAIIGKAIGMENLKWTKISDEQMLNIMLSAGMNKQISEGFVAMQAAQGSGVLYEDFYKNKPEFGKTKLDDFAKDFATVYNAQ